VSGTTAGIRYSVPGYHCEESQSETPRLFIPNTATISDRASPTFSVRPEGA